MDILSVVSVIIVGITLATIWHLGHRVPLRDLAMVADATRSPRACLGFIQFCLSNAD